MNKVKGQLGFPQKTKPPSGATAGGTPPPQIVPFFAKKIVANVPSTPQPKFWVNLRGMQAAKG
jgi:hypothetical protein